MSSLFDIAWAVPLLPFGAAAIVSILLISFSRTVNRLTKPISILMIASVSFSLLLSTLLYQKHISGTTELWQISDFKLGFYLNDFREISAISIDSIFLIIMSVSFYLRPRKKGYVRYFSLLGLLCGISLYFICSMSMFDSFMAYLPLSAFSAFVFN